jgi:formate dehydrogenase assembly factor FdhD
VVKNVPFKTIEERRKYVREWMYNKRHGLPTRTTIRPTKEESREKRNIREQRYRKARRERSRKYLEFIYGKTCVICGEERIMIIHRKDGKKHKLFTNMSITQIKKELESHKDEYVRVCGICHAGVHWAMTYLGLKWEDIPLRSKLKG